jgi:hypothetical protein
MSSIIRAMVICPFTREMREAQIENSRREFQRICGGGYIKFGIWINRKDVTSTISRTGPNTS